MRSAVDTNELLTVRIVLWWVENSSHATREERLEHGERILGLPFSLEFLLDVRRRYRAARETFAATPALGARGGFQAALDELLRVYRDTWKVLGKLMQGHPLHLPTMYLSGELKQLVTRILIQIGVREPCESWGPERFDQALQPKQTGSFALGGVKGVGKTTLMRAVALAVAITSPNYFLVFVNLATEGPFQRGERSVNDIYRMVRSQMRLLVDSLQSDPRTVGLFPLPKFQSVDPKRGQSRVFNPNPSLIRGTGGLPPLGVGIMVDEVQQLEEIERGIARKFLSDLGQYGREQPVGMVIVAGSSLRIREILGIETGLSTIVTWDRQLASFCYVPAARSAEGLKDYLETRYPGRDDVQRLTGDMLNALLHATGGIGRYIEELFCIMTNLVQEGESASAVVAAIDASGYGRLSRKFQMYRPLPSPIPIAPYVIALLRQHALNRDRVEAIVRDIQENGDVVVAPSDVEARLDRIVEGLVPLLPVDSLPSRVSPIVAARELVLRLVDAEVLYISNYHSPLETVQIAVPSDAKDHFANAPSREDVERLVAFASSQLLEPGEVNAGLGVERFAFPRLRNITEWRDWTRTSEVVRDRELSVSEGNVYISSGDGTNRLATETELDGKTWQWKSEIGLDAVYINFAAGEIQVRGWQGKTGSKSASYSLGSLATYRRHLRFNNKEVYVFLRKKDKRPAAAITATSTLAGSAPYSSFPALLVRAEQGFLTLCSALQSMFPDHTVRVMSLLVTTTKEIPERWSRSFSSVTMDPRHVEAMGMRGVQEYEVRVRSGFGWILEELVDSEALKTPLQSAIYVMENGAGAFGLCATAEASGRRRSEMAALSAFGGDFRETARTKWTPPTQAASSEWSEEWTTSTQAAPFDKSSVRIAKRGRPDTGHEEEDNDDDDGDDRHAGRAGHPPNKRPRFRKKPEGPS